jgi:hypothetical protein
MLKARTADNWNEFIEERNMKQSDLEAHMARDIMVLRQSDGREWLPEPEEEYEFHPVRKWRFDFAWPGPDDSWKIAVEVEGGKWTKGRHQRPQGFEDDMEKYNTAVNMGWRVFRFTGDMVQDGRAYAFLETVFAPF